MLNMLIAIMGDTYEKVIENKELNATKTKLELVSELSNNIRDSEEDNNDFLFVVTPLEKDDDGSGTWDGTVNQINRKV